MAKNSGGGPKGNEAYYTRLLIDKRQRFLINFVALFFFILTTSWLFSQMINKDSHWQTFVWPIMVFGVATLLIKPSEEWEYVPWQSKPVRKEVSSYD